MDHLTRVQALALARIAELPLPIPAETARRDALLASALLEMLEAKDPYTRAHSERVGLRAVQIASELGCGGELVERVRLAGELHDLGKLGVPDAVLGKRGPLSAREWGAMRRHPELAARLLEPLGSLADVALYARHHHEWFDGSAPGYPDHLRGAQIPLPSRIVAVADSLEAMTARRNYRRSRTSAEALDELLALRGRQFDPDVLDAALQLAQQRSDEVARAPLRAVGDDE